MPWTRRYLYDPAPALQDNVTDPVSVGAVVAKFVAVIRFLQETHHISLLCFIKQPGTSGAVGMTSALVQSLNLPAAIWSEGKIVGHHPTYGDGIAIVHDVIVTGGTITRVAKDIKHQYQITPVAAIVFASQRFVHELDVGGDQCIPVTIVDNLMDEMGETPLHRVPSLITNAQQLNYRGAASLKVGQEGIESSRGESMSDPGRFSPLSIALRTLPFLIATALGWVTVQSPDLTMHKGLILIGLQIIFCVLGIYMWFRRSDDC